MSPIYQHQVRIHGKIRGRKRDRRPFLTRASLEYRDDEGLPALMPMRWNARSVCLVDLMDLLDRDAVVTGYLGTDARGHPVLYVLRCEAADGWQSPRPAPASGGGARRAAAG